MFQFKDHVDHYDDVFTSLPYAIDHMKWMIKCDAEDINKSHYTIIDDTTGEVVSEYISDNYHLFTKANMLQFLSCTGEYISGLSNAPALQREQIPLWIIEDIRRCSQRLNNLANAMDAVLPHAGD